MLLIKIPNSYEVVTKLQKLFIIRCNEWGEKNVTKEIESLLEDDDTSIEESTTWTYFDISNSTEAPEIVKICINSTEDKSQPKELQFVRNIVF